MRDSVPTPLLDELDSFSATQLAWMMKAMDERPLELFEELRRTRPNIEVNNVVFVSRFADVMEVLRYPTTFSVRLYKAKMGDFLMAHDETPTHRRDKSVMQAMTPQSDELRIRQLVDEYCNQAIDQSGGEIEIVDKLTRAAPIHVVQEYFGLDGIDPAQLREWSYWAQYDNFHNQPFQAKKNTDEINARSKQAKQELAQYSAELVQRRAGELQSDPDRDDVVSRMLKARLPESLGFGPERLVLNTMGLLIGSVETTSHATTNIVDALLDRPEQLKATAACAADGDFEKLSEYVWEASRFQPLAPYMFRYCEQDFTIAKGTDRSLLIRAGQTVLPLSQSAMFDSTEFEDPKEFRHSRPSYQSFLFGIGNHRCLGEYVGRQMIPAIVGALAQRANLRRADCESGQIDFQGGPFPESLTLKFDA